MAERRQPGEVRDAIVHFLKKHKDGASVAEIEKAVNDRIGHVPSSSIRSYLRLNTLRLFDRTGRGHYRMAENK